MLCFAAHPQPGRLGPQVAGRPELSRGWLRVRERKEVKDGVGWWKRGRESEGGKGEGGREEGRES